MFSVSNLTFLLLSVTGGLQLVVNFLYLHLIRVLTVGLDNEMPTL